MATFSWMDLGRSAAAWPPTTKPDAPTASVTGDGTAAAPTEDEPDGTCPPALTRVAWSVSRVLGVTEMPGRAHTVLATGPWLGPGGTSSGVWQRGVGRGRGGDGALMGSWAAAGKLKTSSTDLSGAVPAGAALPPRLGELVEGAEGRMRDCFSADDQQPAHNFLLLVLRVASCADTSSGPHNNGSAAGPGMYSARDARPLWWRIDTQGSNAEGPRRVRGARHPVHMPTTTPLE